MEAAQPGQEAVTQLGHRLFHGERLEQEPDVIGIGALLAPADIDDGPDAVISLQTSCLEDR
jgi:hypothetical protein